MIIMQQEQAKSKRAEWLPPRRTGGDCGSGEGGIKPPRWVPKDIDGGDSGGSEVGKRQERDRLKIGRTIVGGGARIRTAHQM
jgi:hypothetical protein